MLIASLASEVMVDCFTHNIHSAWKMVFPASLEVMTIWAMFRWGGENALIQAVLLVVAWLAHLLLYADAVLGTDIIWSRYDTAIQMIAVGQLVACYDTLFYVFNRLAGLAARLAGLVATRSLSDPSVRNSVLRSEGERQI